MQKVKYIIITIFIMIGLIITGELYQSYTDSVSDFYETTFYVQPGIDADYMIEDIYNTAQSHNVSVFFIDKFVENSFSTKISVYSDEKIRNILISDYYLRKGKIKSFFSGSTEVNYYDYMDVPEKIIDGDTPTYYLYGEYDDMVEMKRELIDKYGGKFPKDEGYRGIEEQYSAVTAIWIIIGILICFLSFYAIVISQREYMVRATMGENLFSIYLKTVLLDTVFMISVFLIEYSILLNFTNVSFLSDISFGAIIIIAVTNCLLSLKILFFKIREAFSKTAGRQELIFGSYVIKVISCCTVMVLLTFQFSTMKEALSYYKQKDFFKGLSDYSYVSIRYNGTHEVRDQFLRCFDDRYLIADPCIGFGEDGLVGDNTNTAVLMNYDMIKKISDFNSALSGVELPTGGCIIVPESSVISEEDYEYLKQSITEYSTLDNELSTDDIPVIEYKDETVIIAVEKGFINFSEWWEQPVIVAIDYYDWPLLNEEELTDNVGAFSVREYNMMVKASSQEIYEFIDQYKDCKADVTNVYEYYQYRWTVLKRTMYLSIIIAMMLILLEVSINILIVNFEYKFNSVELALKKILSYSKAERLKRLCLTTGIIITISTILCFLVIKFLGLDYAFLSVISSVLVLVLNHLVIVLSMEKNDKVNIPKILKGGVV